MSFFNRKHTYFFPLLLVSFLLLSLIPTQTVKAFADTCDTTGKAILPPGQKFAKIYVTGDKTFNGDETPKGGKTCYVPMMESASVLTYDNLLAGNIIAAGWKDNKVVVLNIDCLDKNNADYKTEFQNVRLEEGNPPKLADLQFRLLQKDGCYKLIESGLNHVNDKNKTTGYAIIDGVNQYMFFQGFQEANKDEQKALDQCKIALAQFTIKDGPNKGLLCQVQDSALQKPGQPLDYMAGLRALPIECQNEFNACVKNQTGKGGDTTDPHKGDPRYGVPDGYTGPLPACAFSYDGCRNINDLLEFFVNIGQTLFQVIGTFAFVMFIYGGLTIIMSMGSPEKVKKGQEILTAAVVGIVIAFGAYLMVDFILDVFQVDKEFRGVGNLDINDKVEDPAKK